MLAFIIKTIAETSEVVVPKLPTTMAVLTTTLAVVAVGLQRKAKRKLVLQLFRHSIRQMFNRKRIDPDTRITGKVALQFTAIALGVFLFIWAVATGPIWLKIVLLSCLIGLAFYIRLHK